MHPVKGMSILVLLTALSSCERAGAQEVVDVPIPVCANVDEHGFESAPWAPLPESCEWLPFNGETSYRIHHNLGRVPRSIDIYLAFDSSGRRSAPSAGDMSRILTATEEYVELENAVEQDFFVRIALD